LTLKTAPLAGQPMRINLVTFPDEEDMVIAPELREVVSRDEPVVEIEEDLDTYAIMQHNATLSVTMQAIDPAFRDRVTPEAGVRMQECPSNPASMDFTNRQGVEGMHFINRQGFEGTHFNNIEGTDFQGESNLANAVAAASEFLNTSAGLGRSTLSSSGFAGSTDEAMVDGEQGSDAPDKFFAGTPLQKLSPDEYQRWVHNSMHVISNVLGQAGDPDNDADFNKLEFSAMCNETLVPHWDLFWMNYDSKYFGFDRWDMEQPMLQYKLICYHPLVIDDYHRTLLGV